MTERSEFKGNELLVLKWKPDDKYPFQFGRAKAKLIVANIDAIRTFANEDGGKAPRVNKSSYEEDIPF